MSLHSVLELTTAVARSGKSYGEVKYLVDHFLPEEHGHYYTNIPMNVRAIARWCKKKHKMRYKDVLKRVHIIQRETETEWMNDGSGPWDYFRDKDINGALIVIDECHNFCGVRLKTTHTKHWMSWLGEVSHCGGKIRMLSQSYDKVHKDVKTETAVNYELVNWSARPDPYLHIDNGDWMELGAGLLGMKYRQFYQKQELRKVRGRLTKGRVEIVQIDPAYFPLYDSFSQPIAHGGVKVDKYLHEHEKRSKLGLIIWFVKKWSYQLLTRGVGFFVLLVFGLWFFFGGGIRSLTTTVQTITSKSISSNERKPKTKSVTSVKSSAPAPVGSPSNPVSVPALSKPVKNSEVDRLQSENESLKSERDKLQSMVDASSLMFLMTPDSITFSNAVTLKVGDEITSGKYKGAKVETVDWSKRQAVLDSGDILTLDN